MPLPGGAADKAGGEYERAWIVRQVLRLLTEDAVMICLEPVGPEGQGVEFWLDTPAGVREYHQCKRQHALQDKWTIPSLAGVLQDAYRLLAAKPRARFVFASMVPCSPLRELCERAASTRGDYGGFQCAVAQTQELEKAFQDTCSCLAQAKGQEVDKCKLHDVLGRCAWKTVDHSELQSMTEALLSVHVEGDCAAAAELLASYAIANVHQELHADCFWSHLEAHDFPRCDWSARDSVLARIRELQDQFNASVSQSLIHAELIERRDADALAAEVLAEEGGRLFLVTGTAGSGKSSVLLQLAQSLQEQGVPFLPLRLDRQVPSATSSAFGEEQGLPGSPALVLAGVAHGRPAVLILDQVDAIRWTSLHSAAAWETVQELVRQATRYLNVRIVLACRKFDLETNRRLSAWKRQNNERIQTIEIGPLDDETAMAHVGRTDVDWEDFSEAQQELLCQPLHLFLFLQVAGDPRATAFRSDTDLYNLLWDNRRQAFRDMNLPDRDWSGCVKTMAEAADQRGSSAIPRAALDCYATALDALASLHLVTVQEDQVAFFHQGFHDYVVARGLCAQGLDVVEYVRETDQSLFQRERLRQILNYMRGADFDRYVSEARALLETEDIRFHLKHFVLQFLGALGKPTREEWSILEPMVRSHRLAGHVRFEALAGRPAWFDLLQKDGSWERWLRDADDDWVNKVVWLLWRACDSRPNEVAALLAPFVGQGDAWASRLARFLDLADLGAGRALFDLALSSLRAGLLDGADHLGHGLHDKQPQWAAELVAEWLGREADKVERAACEKDDDLRWGEERPKQIDYRLFGSAAEGAPEFFLRAVLPQLLRIGRYTAADVSRSGFRNDRTWWRWGHGCILGKDAFMHASECVLAGCERAVRRLTDKAPSSLSPMLKRLGGSDLAVAQYLCLRGYTFAAARLPNEALHFLLGDPRRLRLDISGRPWPARDLVEAATPHCSATCIEALLGVLLSYTDADEWELAKADVRERLRQPATERRYRPNPVGHRQYFLLSAVAESRLSGVARRRVQEFRRKFGPPNFTRSPGVELSFVGSPIPLAGCCRMSDSEWLGAMRKYSKDREFRNTGDDRWLGGAVELSRQLQRMASRQGERFANLGLRMPLDLHPYYFGAIVHGLAEPPNESKGEPEIPAGPAADIALMACLVERLHEIKDWPCAREVCWLVRKTADRPWPDSVLRIIAEYATKHRDPQRETWRDGFENGGTIGYGGDMFSEGINTTRGAAAEAISSLLWANSARAELLRESVETLVCDPSPAVRSCAVECCTFWLQIDRDEAVQLFLRLTAIDEDRLLSTRMIWRFLLYAIRTHARALSDVVDRMVNSRFPEVAERGATLAWGAWSMQGVSPETADSCRDGSEAQRIGCAKAAAQLYETEACREAAHDLLKVAFQDASSEVRRAACETFRVREGEPADYLANLMDECLKSPARSEGIRGILHTVEHTGTPILRFADVILSAVALLSSDLAEEAESIQGSLGFEARQIARILLRIYEQARERGKDELAEKCLDSIDRMLEAQVGDAPRRISEMLGWSAI